MDKKAIFEELKKIAVKQLGVREEQVIPEARFGDDLGADSLDFVELIMQLEDHYGINVPEEDAEKLITVGDVVDYLIGYALVPKPRREQERILA